MLPLVLLAAIAAGGLACQPLPLKRLVTIGLPLALALVAAWLAATYLGAAARDDAVAFIREWARYDRRTYGLPSVPVLSFLGRNLFLYTWPVWPIAAWSGWPGRACAAHPTSPSR